MEGVAASTIPGLEDIIAEDVVHLVHHLVGKTIAQRCCTHHTGSQCFRMLPLHMFACYIATRGRVEAYEVSLPVFKGIVQQARQPADAALMLPSDWSCGPSPFRALAGSSFES